MDTTQGYFLEPYTLEEIQTEFGTLTTTGSPTYWYRTTTGVATYPVTTDTVTVRYWKRTPVLTESDTPASPADHHMLIVDMAVQLAYRDSDNHQAAEGLQVDIDRQLAEMVDDLLPQSEPVFQRITWASEDW